MNKRAAFTALMLLLSPTIALAGESPLLGTWKLKSFVREVAATGEKYNQMGEHPSGYLSYSADGRMYAIGTSDNRVKPLEANQQMSSGSNCTRPCSHTLAPTRWKATRWSITWTSHGTKLGREPI